MGSTPIIVSTRAIWTAAVKLGPDKIPRHGLKTTTEKRSLTAGNSTGNYLMKG